MKINELKESLAIAMWDSSWLRRRYDGGGFENFDQVLDELVDRGYNAVRIDVFPHLIANAPDGTNSERFLDPSGFGNHQFGFAGWGSPWTVYTYPRRDVVEFIKACEARNVYVLLSTWLKPTADPRNEWVNGPEDLIRIWDETLQFLSENDCMKNIIGVDVENEIPVGAGNSWLYDQLNHLKTPEKSWNQFNEKQKSFYCDYFRVVLKELRNRWPEIPFAASMDWSVYSQDREMDFSEWDFLDMHIWAENANHINIFEDVAIQEVARMHVGIKCNDTLFSNPYVGLGRIMPPDINFEKINEDMLENWYKKRPLFEEWLEEEIAFVAQRGKKYGIPVGNTEGWGTIFWRQHPLLTWDLIKDAGLLGAKLGRKYGYTFNCQSNFCEPQFISLWRDIEYHREVTSIIRGTNVSELKG